MKNNIDMIIAVLVVVIVVVLCLVFKGAQPPVPPKGSVTPVNVSPVKVPDAPVR
ncbi:MAG: hypothetical protein JSS72_03215 [Armatimonadetes bacterium]|nr:hypothetical protein [Armatimonadota bacterium]